MHRSLTAELRAEFDKHLASLEPGDAIKGRVQDFQFVGRPMSRETDGPPHGGTLGVAVVAIGGVLSVTNGTAEPKRIGEARILGDHLPAGRFRTTVSIEHASCLLTPSCSPLAYHISSRLLRPVEECLL